ncbi:hypothetical protein CL1_0845 [Thermococcus cleftensis]|uniref:DUF4350 domain-containing protein n=1 Tax=Thermococcus cleftensis (strain DSM 27260 / KACC 17922 / CL1) TaxID=163003 RepID=I3ZTL6_THECF|nr:MULTISPECIES: DUF4350 domain-containing protein [Thermococcus]AFL95050.1 hypothetical protein CL1_0845 [Thermococcus cleftensis]NJE03864.1 DUF4350 domain-containing protein [Thermococcus sp. MV11]
MNRTVKYLTLLLLLFALITMPITVPLFKSSTQYSIFNWNWDGTSKFARLAGSMGREIVPIFESFDIANISEKSGVLLIIGPNMTFTDAEVAQIRAFLERGNTVLIADDFGTGNDILRALKLPVGISEYPLRDFFYETDDRLIVAVRIENPLLARNVSRIVTNEPSGIIVAREGEAYASRVAMINLHRRMFPIMAEVPYGKGRVIVLSDPDVLANMQFRDNEQFLRNLVDYLGGGTFYFDEAHHPDFSLYTVGTVTVTRVLPKDRAGELILAVATLLLARELGLFSALGRLIHRLLSRFFGRKVGTEELALALAKERGWDEGEVLEMLRRMGG